MLKIFSTIVALVIIGAIATGSLQKTTSHKTPPDSLKIVTPAISVEQNTIPTNIITSTDWKKSLWETSEKELGYPEFIFSNPTPVIPTHTEKEADPVLSEKPTVKKDTALESPEIAELRSFGNTLGTTLKTFYADTDRDKNTLAVLATTTGTVNFEAVRALSKIYTAFSQTVEVIPAPKAVAELHQELVLSYRHLGSAITTLAEKEPSRPDSQAWNGYNRALVESLSALIHIASFFKNNNIVFAQNEAGAIFVSN
ncbi:MAG: hypothetical protein AAB447_03080 [Patescibacteria group bacterium]